MKGLWIRVEAHEVDSVRVAELAETLGISPVTALGHLVALGGAVGEHTPDGQISVVSDAVIERWARWDGKRGAFGRAVREILQDGEGYLDDWRESMGQLIERRQADRRRKGYGNSKESPRKGDGNSSEIPRKDDGIPPNFRTDSAATERNGTERKGKTPARDKPAKLDVLATGELVNRIRALSVTPPQGAPYIPRPRVAELGDDVVRAFDAVGGGRRFLESTGKESSFLIREFGQALESAREQLENPA